MLQDVVPDFVYDLLPTRYPEFQIVAPEGELQDVDGAPIGHLEAKRVITYHYTVPDQVRAEARRTAQPRTEPTDPLNRPQPVVPPIAAILVGAEESPTWSARTTGYRR